MNAAEKAARSLSILAEVYVADPARPERLLALNFTTPLDLLVATMLSAQCTDERVNMVTASLFRRFRTARDYADADPAVLERAVSSINFYRNKAANIRAAARRIDEAFGGEVPETLEGLLSLHGVGRKTANVVLANAFGQDALAVDTHVKRVAARLGLTNETDPDRVEEALVKIVAPGRRAATTRLLILHGRGTCRARAPLCGECRLAGLCDYFKRAAIGKGVCA